MYTEQLQKLLAKGKISQDQFETTCQVMQMVGELDDRLELKVVGKKGVHVEGNVTGTIVPGNENIVGNGDVYHADSIIFFNDPERLKEDEKNRLTKKRLRDTYLRSVIDSCNNLELSTVHKELLKEKQNKLNLSSVYIPLSSTENNSILEQMNEHKHLVLLGDSGSGKSTFVKFLGLCFAGQLLRDADFPNMDIGLLIKPLPKEMERANHEVREPNPQLWNHGGLLPVRINLPDLVAARSLAPEEKMTYEFFELYIENELKGLNLVDYWEDMRRELLDGGLIMFDGLDEVPDVDLKLAQTLELINSVRVAFPKCHILITSRPYICKRSDWDLYDFNQVTIAPFGADEKNQFVNNWFDDSFKTFSQSLDNNEKRKNKALMQQVINRNLHLSRLTEKPELLTLLAIYSVSEYKTSMYSRGALYSSIISLLLNHPNKIQLKDDFSSISTPLEPSFENWIKLKHKKDEVFNFLGNLAFKGLRNQDTKAFLDKSSLANFNKDDLVIGIHNLQTDTQIQLDTESIIRYLNIRAEILVEKENQTYVFTNRLIQDYLAACYLSGIKEKLSNKGVPQKTFPHNIAVLVEEDPYRWREVALLAGAKVSQDPIAFWSLIEVLCPLDRNLNEVVSVEDGWGAYLAAQIIAENVEIRSLEKTESLKLERVKRWLDHLITASSFPAEERMEIGACIGKLGDNRVNILNLAEMEFCFVPKGEFVMGSDANELLDEGSEWWPKHNQNLKYDYWMGKFPVSNAQYQKFVDQEGYLNEEYWVEAKEHGFWSEGNVTIYTHSHLAGDGDFQTRDHQANYGEPFNLPNHPVVGVSWYEALAFSRWLNEIGHSKGWMSEKHEIKLPNEPEWEKAAKGGLRIPDLQTSSVITTLRKLMKFEPNKRIFMKENPDINRLYPWLDSPSVMPEYGNYLIDSQSTSALGIYPLGKSPYACEEMGGNVAEWTRSLHGVYDRESKKYKMQFDYPYNATDGREILASDQLYRRTLKMGVWGGGSVWSACSARDGVNPHVGYDLYGFRVCVVPV